ncbi:MAG: ABC-2 transporter permease [Ruminiclostridium sp.]|nr:ABC-2 transporter permease [Ruminiclostridium sp.]
MQTYLDIIRTDIIMMNGAKNSMRPLIILMLVLGAAVGLFIDPMGTYLCVLIAAAGFVPMIFQVQGKNNCEKLYSLLPISRKQLVTARFIFALIAYAAVSVIMFAIMKISFAAGVYKNAGFWDAFVQNFGMSIDRIYDTLFFIVFAAGAVITGASLKSWFSNSNMDTAMNGAARVKPKTVIVTLIILFVYIFIMLFFSGMIPLDAAALVVLQLIVQLVTAADGLLFCAVMTALAGFSAMYNYVCTVLEYDDKDM